MDYHYQFHGSFADYPMFVAMVDQKLGAKGKKFVINKHTRRPRKPHHGAQFREVENYDKKKKDYLVDCEVALSIITSLLGPAPLARVQFIVNDSETRSDREKCIDILDQLKLEYVPPTNITADLFKASIEAIPVIDPLCSKQEAANAIENIMTVMTTQSALLELHHYKSRIRQVDLIRVFFDKANHEILESYKTMQINQATEGKQYNFALLCREIRAQLIGKKLLTHSVQVVKIQSPPGYVPVRTFSADTSASLQASVATAQMLSPSSEKSSSNLRSPKQGYETRPCFNCQGLHKNSECPAAFCRNCSKMFRSTTDPAYHHFTSCTQRPSAKRGNNTTNISSNIQRYDRPKFKPRTNVAIEQEQDQDQDNYEQEQDSEDSFFCNMVSGQDTFSMSSVNVSGNDNGSDDGMPDLVTDSSDSDSEYCSPHSSFVHARNYKLNVKFAINKSRLVVTNETESLYSIMYFVSNNSILELLALVDEDRVNYHCTMMNSESPHCKLPPCVSNDKLVHTVLAMVDSGTNVKVCSYKYPEMLNIPVQRYKQSRRIVFGNNSVSYAEHFAYFGPLIGNVSLLEGASDFLLSVEHLTSKRIIILFKEDKVYFLDQEFKIITIGSNATNSTRLYYVDILPLIKFDQTLHLKTNILEEPQIQAVVNSRKEIPVTQQQVREVMALHKRLNHASRQTMVAGIKHHIWLNADIEHETIDRVMSRYNCLGCSLGKSNKLPRQVGAQVTKVYVGDELSVDRLGPILPVAIGKFTYVYLFVDLASDFWISILAKPPANAAQFLAAFQQVRLYFKRYGHVVKKLRFDAGVIENSAIVHDFLSSISVQFDSAAPEAQYQNPVERHLQTLVKKTATMLVDQTNLGAEYWGLAVLAATDTRNSWPSLKNENYQCPSFTVTNIHPDLSRRFKFSFGQSLACVIPQSAQKNFKFSPRAEIGFAVGSAPGSNGATLVLFPQRSTTRVFQRIDVRAVDFPSQSASFTKMQATNFVFPIIAHDGSTQFESASIVQTTPVDSEPQLKEELPSLDSISVEYMSTSIPVEVSEADSAQIVPALSSEISVADSISAVDISSSLGEPIPTVGIISATLDNPTVIEQSPADNVSDTSVFQVPLKRLRRANKQYEKFITNAMKFGSSDPDYVHIVQALEGDDGEEWWQTIMDEVSGLTSLQVGDEILLADVPPDCQILDTKFILKVKRNALYEIIKKKARMVVFGNREQLDPQTNLFSPTANDKSVKLFFAICAHLGLKIIGFDIFLAFLYARIRRFIVIRLPKQILKDGKRVLWKLNKTLYGLQDSPRILNEDIHVLLVSDGYRPSPADPCIYLKGVVQDADFILAVLIVDDFAVASKSDNSIQNLRQLLKSKYTITESFPLDSFVGIHIMYNVDKSITLSMSGQITKLCAKYLTANDTALNTPMLATFDEDFQNDSVLCDSQDYNCRVGEFIFLLKVRLDICLTISRLSHRKVCPTVRDIAATKHLLRYLLGTRDDGITYHFTNNGDKYVLKLISWVDAAFNVYHDSKSQIGFCLSLGNHLHAGMLYATSAKTKTIPLSSTEAEGDAMVELTKNIIWYKMVLTDLGFDTSTATIVHEDNDSLITLVKHYSGNHKRVKHFLLQINFLIESANNGIIAPVKIPGPLNCADMLTKPKGFTEFQPQKEQILGRRST